MAKIVSARQKWARLEAEYLYSDWTYDNIFLMSGGKGGDISACKIILFYFIF